MLHKTNFKQTILFWGGENPFDIFKSLSIFLKSLSLSRHFGVALFCLAHYNEHTYFLTNEKKISFMDERL